MSNEELRANLLKLAKACLEDDNEYATYEQEVASMSEDHLRLEASYNGILDIE